MLELIGIIFITIIALSVAPYVILTAAVIVSEIIKLFRSKK